MNDFELDRALREALASRAERTTVTDREFGDREIVTMSRPRRRVPALATGLAVAAAVAIAIGVGAVVAKGGDDGDSDVAAQPYSVSVADGAYVDMSAVEPDGFFVQREPYSTQVGCLEWTDSLTGATCTKVGGESTLQFIGTGDERIYATVRRYQSHVPSPGETVDINGATARYVVPDPDSLEYSRVEWEPEPGIWVTVEASASVPADTLFELARSVEMVEAELSEPLPFVVYPVDVTIEEAQFGSLGVAVELLAERPCIGLLVGIPCDPPVFDGPLAIGPSASGVAFGLLQSSVERVEFRPAGGGPGVPAELVDVPNATVRAWVVVDDSIVAGGTVVALGLDGTELASIDIAPMG